MATSGNSVLTTTRDEICYDALHLLGVTALTDTPSATDLALATRVLNRVVKKLQSMDIPLWKTQEVALFPALEQVTYTLGSSGTAKATVNYTQTSLASDAAVGASAIVVDSATGIAATYQIGIQLDSGDFQWTTVSSVVGTTINLGAVLTDAVTSGGYVYVFQTAYNKKPLKIKDARRRNPQNQTDCPLSLMARSDYNWLADKYLPGLVNSFFYDVGLSTGTVYLFQAPQYPEQIVILTCITPFDIFDDVTDEPDFPDFWFEGLIYNLAESLIPYYGIKGEKAQFIVAKAAEFRAEAEDFDREDGSIFFTVDGNS